MTLELEVLVTSWVADRDALTGEQREALHEAVRSAGADAWAQLLSDCVLTVHEYAQLLEEADVARSDTAWSTPSRARLEDHCELVREKLRAPFGASARSTGEL